MERGGSPDLIERLTPDVLMEESSAVRAAALIARVRAYRHDSSRSISLFELLSDEAASTGVQMDLRRRAAIAALLEMGKADRVAQIYSDSQDTYLSDWYASLNPDSVSLGALLDHWPELQAAATTRNLNIMFPINHLVDAGYGAFIERVLRVRSQLSESLLKEKWDWRVKQKLEILSRLHPRSAELRLVLYKILHRRARGLPDGPDACLATRLLGEHFGGDSEILANVIPEGQFPDPASGSPGVLGHMVRAWPTSDLASAARNSSAEDRRHWSDLDRLICATTWGHWDQGTIPSPPR